MFRVISAVILLILISLNISNVRFSKDSKKKLAAVLNSIENKTTYSIEFSLVNLTLGVIEGRVLSSVKIQQPLALIPNNLNLRKQNACFLNLSEPEDSSFAFIYRFNFIMPSDFFKHHYSFNTFNDDFSSITHQSDVPYIECFASIPNTEY